MPFTLTIFEEIRKFLSLPSFSPGQAVLVSLFLKKIQKCLSLPVSFPNVQFFSYCVWKNLNFLLLFSFLPRGRNFFSWLKKSWLFSWITIFRSSCGSHIVHMQKIRNRSNFFQKIFTSGIFPKILKAFRFYQVYCQKFWKQYRFFEKNLHIRYISRIFENVLAFQNFFQKKRYTLPGLFPKQHPVVLLLSEKIPKNIISHHWLSQLPPCFVTPFFNFFSKIFVSPLLTITFLPRKGHTCSKNFSKKTPHCWLSHFFCVLFLHSWKKVEKSYRSGIKSWWQAITNNNLPEREY